MKYQIPSIEVVEGRAGPLLSCGPLPCSLLGPVPVGLLLEGVSQGSASYRAVGRAWEDQEAVSQSPPRPQAPVRAPSLPRVILLPCIHTRSPIVGKLFLQAILLTVTTTRPQASPRPALQRGACAVPNHPKQGRG